MEAPIPFPRDLQRLHDQLQAELSGLENGVGEPPLELCRKGMDFIKSALQELKQWLLRSAFACPEEEIHFFKRIKPAFHHLLMYQRGIFDIEIRLPAGSRKLKRRYYELHLRRLNRFLERHAEFYKYYRSGETNLDPLYFRREPANPELDPVFSSPRDLLLSQLLAAEKLRAWLEKAKSKLDTHKLSQPEKPVSPLRWTASKASLVELIYGLHQTGVCNHGHAELKALATTLEQLFQVDLGNYYGVFNEIRLRKKNRTPLLDDMKLKLIGRMDELDG